MIASLIWGVAFVAQSVGMDYIGPFTFNAVRNFIGCLVLLPVMAIAARLRKKGDTEKLKAQSRQSRKLLLGGGTLCGVLLFAASSLQQVGIQHTSVGKAGFLTALYIVFVPILGLLFGRKSTAKIWISVAIALVGTYLLSVREGFSVNRGDIYIILCAVVFSFHIMLVDRISPQVDGIKLSSLQFFVSGVLSLVVALAFETFTVSTVLSAWQPLLYTGVMSSGVAYTFQIIGQRGTNPTVASIIMSMESLFSAVSGWLILGEKMSGKELLGCALVLAAVIFSQLPSRKQPKAEG